MAIQQLADRADAHEAYRLADHRIRRCTFRRLIAVDAGSERVYEVECLFPERRVPILGDLDAATPICNTCTAAHIFPPRRGLTGLSTLGVAEGAWPSGYGRRATSPRRSVSEAVCKPSSVPRSLAGTVIHLGRSPDGSCGRPEGWAAHSSPAMPHGTDGLRPPIWPCSG